MHRILWLFICPLLLLLLFDGPGEHAVRAGEDNCNEFVCGSIVSKCLLTQSCQCKLSDCYCCKDCLHCLGDLYTECCSCLDMCPKQNDTLGGTQTPKSQVGDFDGVPELFEALTTDEDDDEWTVLRFPMRASSMRRPFDLAAAPAVTDAIDRQASLQKMQSSVNCTVIYLSSCQRNDKCAQYCESMGASSYRWFHDGCCECVGAHCFNYGINESRCTACPEDEPEAPEVDDGANEDNYAGDNDGGGDAVEAKRTAGSNNNDDHDDDAGDESQWTYGEDEINYN